MSENNLENETNIEPLIQMKQECIYCLGPLLDGEEVDIYIMVIVLFIKIGYVINLVFTKFLNIESRIVNII